MPPLSVDRFSAVSASHAHWPYRTSLSPAASERADYRKLCLSCAAISDDACLSRSEEVSVASVLVLWTFVYPSLVIRRYRGALRTPRIRSPAPARRCRNHSMLEAAMIAIPACLVPRLFQLARSESEGLRSASFLREIFRGDSVFCRISSLRALSFRRDSDTVY